MTGPSGRGGSGEAPEPDFADVLNNISVDSGRSWWRYRRAAEGQADEPAHGPAEETAEETVEETAAESGEEPAGDHEAAEPAGEFEDSAAAVRPYTWTRGRTRPVHDLAVEALVSTTEHGHDVAALTSVEHRAIAELCQGPCSVAELAALLALPLGVVRVLLSDMTDLGLVVVHPTAGGSGDVPDMALMERVLSGLR
ncbi:MAG: DUF742 domain-containing protein, partial [Pseudonocardiaceae bacterium]|nr:DUF742 domain-containing protein [Pseudonocardiaceae bacterium]